MDYNILASQEQVLAYFLPEAPAEMLKIFDEVSFIRPCSHGTKFNQIFKLCSHLHLRLRLRQTSRMGSVATNDGVHT